MAQINDEPERTGDLMCAINAVLHLKSSHLLYINKKECYLD